MSCHTDPQALKVLSSLQRPGNPDLPERVIQAFREELYKVCCLEFDNCRAKAA